MVIKNLIPYTVPVYKIFYVPIKSIPKESLL